MSASYRATLSNFIAQSPMEIFGILSDRCKNHELLEQQREAWKIEIEILKTICQQFLEMEKSAANWSLLLEYNIPRRSKRLDAVLLAADVILCLEFKTGEQTHSLQTDRQVEDYALDLRDFHKASCNRRIVPISVVPKAELVNNFIKRPSTDDVRDVMRANEADLTQVILKAFQTEHKSGHNVIDAKKWDESAYHPVPTIIEAAEALFAGHNVREIAHSHAAENLTVTSEKIIEIIQHAQRNSEKVMCFVTGVPGAGKTLAGLNVVHNPALRRDGRPAGIFLSGNRPLVKVVSAAITRDRKRQAIDDSAERTVGTFIQNVHIFIEVEGKQEEPPYEKIVVFDEAQRAWDAAQSKKKHKRESSEPEIMLKIMDRHSDWAVIIALVGGGQEINSGEAGLSEWGKTLREKYPNWKIAASPMVIESNSSTAGHRLFEDRNRGTLKIQQESSLHLKVTQRSFRAQRFAEWVDAALAGESEKAAMITPDLKDFPFSLTRSLAIARAWLRERTRGFQRSGLVASSGALRLRADGLELTSGFRQGNRDMYVNWFLNLPPDIRSSNQLEVAASEYECQGLELDWVGLCWGGDFSYNADAKDWNYRALSGSRWGFLNNPTDQQYLLNTYRVLLTRARQGVIIWVPEGDSSDPTRLPNFFDPTADYLVRCGVPLV